MSQGKVSREVFSYEDKGRNLNIQLFQLTLSGENQKAYKPRPRGKMGSLRRGGFRKNRVAAMYKLQTNRSSSRELIY